MLAAGCGERDAVVARVGDAEIERGQVESLIELYRRRSEAEAEGGKGERVSHAQELATLQVLMERAMLEQKASELGVKVDEQEVERRAEALRGGDVGARDEEREEGELEEQIRATARAQLLAEALERAVTADVRVSDGRVLAYYRGHRSLYARAGSDAPARPSPRVAASIRRRLLATERSRAMARWLTRVRRELRGGIEYANGWDPRAAGG